MAIGDVFEMTSSCGSHVSHILDRGDGSSGPASDVSFSTLALCSPCSTHGVASSLTLAVVTLYVVDAVDAGTMRCDLAFHWHTNLSVAVDADFACRTLSPDECVAAAVPGADDPLGAGCALVAGPSSHSPSVDDMKSICSACGVLSHVLLACHLCLSPVCTSCTHDSFGWHGCDMCPVDVVTSALPVPNQVRDGDSLRAINIEVARAIRRPWPVPLLRDSRLLGRLQSATYDVVQYIYYSLDGTCCVDPVAHMYVDGSGGRALGDRWCGASSGFAIFVVDGFRSRFLHGFFESNLGVW